MSDRAILIGVALVGWFMAALAAYAIVSLVGFFGVGLIGLAITFIATQFELDFDGVVAGGINSDLLARQVRAEREASPEQRRASRNDKSLQMQSVRFFKFLGIGLAVVGFGGFAYFQM